MENEDIGGGEDGAEAREPITPAMIAEISYRLAMRGVSGRDISIVLSARDFDELAGIALDWHLPHEEAAARMIICGIEVLCGDKSTVVHFSPTIPLGKTNWEPLRMEILSCLRRGAVGELPQRTGGDRVSASPEPVRKVRVTSRTASSDNRDAHRSADELHQLKIVAAKAAIAAYAREKKLPSAEQLAAFRELDDARSPNKALGATLRASIRAEVIKETYRDRHCLASEPLRRAADQVRISERCSPHRDFIGAAAQGFAEMLD